MRTPQTHIASLPSSSRHPLEVEPVHGIFPSRQTITDLRKERWCFVSAIQHERSLESAIEAHSTKASAVAFIALAALFGRQDEDYRLILTPAFEDFLIVGKQLKLIKDHLIMASGIVTTRLAVASDAPVLASLVLTSFRQDQLVYKLYYPVSQNLSYAADTLYYWSRRFLRYILDPKVHVVAAEVPLDWAKAKDKAASREGYEEWWKCLEWVQQHYPHDDEPNGKRIVGFAVWRTEADQGAFQEETQGWWAWAQSTALDRQMSASKWFYGRKDIDPRAYESYFAAEKVWKEMYHIKPFYYLDLLATDFRYSRSGIGEQLVRKGLDLAPNKEWPAITEASKMGYGLYKKMGFEDIGKGSIKFSDPQGDSEMVLPVMRLSSIASYFS